MASERETGLAIESAKAERGRAKAINRVLGGCKLASITPEDVLGYIGGRKSEGISNATINRELDVLRGVLKRAKRWQRFADEIKPLKKSEEAIGRALAHEEKMRLVRIAAARPAWESAYFAAILSLNTTCRACELKGIRWRDVDFLNGTVNIHRSKTAAGHRAIPLNGDAMEVVTAMRCRAEKLGDIRLDDYLFFACENGHIDTSKPQISWRTAWRQLTRAVQCPSCRLLQAPADVCKEESCRSEMKGIRSSTAGLRFHDLRHHAITELAESQTSESVIMGIAGHVSRKMMEHYSHIRLDAKRKALDALSTGKRAYGTTQVTKQRKSFEPSAQVIENMVELVGIEPTASSLRTTRSPS